MEPTQRDDTRNVIDYYKHWTEEAIKGDLRTKHHNFSVMVTNRFNDFNLGTIIRSANAFCAREVIIYGSKQYDRRGTVGAHHYIDLKHVRFEEELKEVLEKVDVVIGVDNYENAVSVETFNWPYDKHILLCFGQETTGLTPDILELCDHLVYITQYGSVRSLNVASAAAITMYDYVQKMPRTV